MSQMTKLALTCPTIKGVCRKPFKSSLVLVGSLFLGMAWLASLIFALNSTPAESSAAIDCPVSEAGESNNLYLPLIHVESGDLGDFSERERLAVQPRLADVVSSKAISVGDAISGSLSTLTDCAAYTFQAQQADTLFFDGGHGINSSLEWTLEDAAGNLLFDTCFSCTPPVHEIGETGQFTLTVGGAAESFHFQIWEVVQPEQFSIEVGDTISPDKPQIGAGQIERPMSTDVYTFPVEIGQVLFFDIQLITNTSAINWRLQDPAGAELFDDCLACGDKGPIDIVTDGTYTLTVGGEPIADIGTYQIKITDAGKPNRFVIEIGDRVGPGNPAEGAGEVEAPGGHDIYTFDLLVSQSVFFEVLETNLTGGTRWMLEDPLGEILFQDCLACGNPGIVELTTLGTYTITVGDQSNNAVGTYKFQTSEAAPPDQFEIEIGDIVFENNPANGAGLIEYPGNIDMYTFSTVSTETVYFDMQSFTSGLTIRWFMNDQNGAQLFNDCIGCGDPGRKLLAADSTFTITIGSETSSRTGSYQFQLWSVPDPQTFEIEIGDSVSPDISAVGAGAIESPGSEDIYTFSASAGQTISLIMQNFSDVGSLRWELKDPDGFRILRKCLACGGGSSITLPADGEYSIVIGNPTSDAFGTYQFELNLAP
ncbi:MAG: hypothetical protein AB8G95_15980 [Anaerolineae bacterium]